MAGSIAERDLETLTPMLPTLLIGAVVGLAIAPALNPLALGNEAAQALGSAVDRIRLTGMVSVVLLAGSAVVAGPIAFIGCCGSAVGAGDILAHHRRSRNARSDCPARRHRDR
ncbi:iron chelate uptake ABC transporter family permease subunit [Nocardia asiatica]